MRTLLRLLSTTAALTGLLVLVLWAVGRLMTDRTLPTQFLSWIPGFLAVPAAAAALIASRLFARRDPRRRNRRPARGLRGLGWLGVIAGAAYVLVVQWRLLAPPPPAPTASAVRILAWNPAQHLAGFEEHLRRNDADIYAIANPPLNFRWVAMQEHLGPEADGAKSSRLLLMSRYRILRWGTTRLGVQGAKARTFRWPGGGMVSIDQGEAIFATLDTKDRLGRDITVWLLDLPSDPDIHRESMMAEAAQTLATFAGPIYERRPAYPDERLEDQPPGFPPPDIILGDFNTPRGSHSLKTLTTLDHAFDRAGRGPAVTWHRKLPVLAIDHAFIASWLDVSRYDTQSLGVGQHLAQFVTVQPRPDDQD